MSLILYHGSFLAVDKPNISFSRNNLDFGKGFYATPIKSQAHNWASRFIRKQGQGVVSAYEFNENTTNAKILTFETYSKEWLSFIISCRQGNTKGNYDIIIGGIANDKVFDTIQLFLDGLVDEAVALKRLQYDKPNIQYCFRNQHIINECLTYTGSETVT